MSRRSLNKKSGSKNPATRFLEWKSDKQAFSYYDKEKGDDIIVNLPLIVQFLEDFSRVKGWHDESKSNIYSNEVKYISRDEITVRSKGGELAKGIYKENKEKIKSLGGHYTKSIYALSENGKIINISLKGSAVSSYSSFMEDNQNNIEHNWLEIREAKELKKGKVEYSVPVFTLGEKYSRSENKRADDAYNSISDYYDEYSSPDSSISDNSSKKSDIDEEEEDDLPF